MANYSIKINVIITAFVAVAGIWSNAQGEVQRKEKVSSIHAGFLDHNGVDVAGYTVHHKLKYGFYGFYTFGFPSIAAAGISYYKNFHNHGPVATIGVGIGSVAYSSLLYQFRIADNNFIKLGAGYTASIAYSGIYPAVSYELRFK